jgi:hypothetical protein
VEDALFVEAMVVASFLVAMHGIVGGVEVQKDTLGGAAAFPSLVHVKLKEGTSDSQTSLGVGGVLQARDRRLAGEVGIGLGQAPQT